MIDWLLGLIDEAQGAIFEDLLQPALYQLGLMNWSEDLFDGTGFALFGAVEIMPHDGHPGRFFKPLAVGSR